jgi:hypothetical protein
MRKQSAEAVPNLISEYSELLKQVQGILEARHHDAWISALRTWREELAVDIDQATLRAHAERTARALGGMESIGEIALASRDTRFLKLVDSLYAKCKQIAEVYKAR